MKSPFIILATTVFFLCLSQCKESGLSSTKTPKEEAHILVQTYCVSCHSISSDKPAPTGPSLSEIRSFYSRHYPEKNNFVEAFVRFMQKPNMENAIMKESIHQYGLMPKMMLNSEQVSLIAQLIHSLEPGSEEWNRQEKSILNRASPTREKIQYEVLGLEYAMAVKTTLGKNLIQAINLGGSEYAVGFCHTRAIPLTDSVSQMQKAEIQRVSDRSRNPENTANDTERSIIDKWKLKIEAGEEMLPELIEWNQKIIAYYPIETNAMCLQCHGVPGKDISETTMKTITSLYPNDLATGYGENQLRGLFKVVIEKEVISQ